MVESGMKGASWGRFDVKQVRGGGWLAQALLPPSSSP